ncbi:MAG: Branched-chain amino acid transport ATP-binding protein LivF, partial [uncultured Acetobacteraceae bacterium]
VERRGAGSPLRRRAGAERRHARPAAGRGPRRARPQRHGQDDAGARRDGPVLAAGHRRGSAARRRAVDRAAAAPRRQTRGRLGPARPSAVPEPVRDGAPHPAQAGRRPDGLDDGARLRGFSPPRGAPEAPGRPAFRGRAADARGRAGADGRPDLPLDGRTFGRAGAGNGAGAGDRGGAVARRRPRHPAGGAEPLQRPRRGRPRFGPGNRARGPRRLGRRRCLRSWRPHPVPGRAL